MMIQTHRCSIVVDAFTWELPCRNQDPAIVDRSPLLKLLRPGPLLGQAVEKDTGKCCSLLQRSSSACLKRSSLILFALYYTSYVATFNLLELVQRLASDANNSIAGPLQKKLTSSA